MPLESEEETYSALDAMTKECGHFRSARVWHRGHNSIYTSFPMYLDHSAARKEGNVHPVLQPSYQKLYFIKQLL